MTDVLSYFCRKLTIVQVILSVLFLGVEGQACGRRVAKYDDTKYLCCGGDLHDLYHDGTERACCQTSDGYKVYRKETELCCGEQIGLNKTYYVNGKQYTRQCCTKYGEIAEPHKLEICCGGYSGDLYKVQLNNKNDRCCGSERYNPSHEHCCEHLQTDTHELYPKQSYELTGCCWTNMYDKEKHKCNKRDGSLRPLRPGIMQCHGGSNYDPDTHICCYEGNIMPKPSTSALARFAVQPDYQCREGIIYDANLVKFEPSSKVLNIVAHTFPRWHRACGNGSYNKEETRHQEFCCDLTVRNASIGVNVDCCGTELYDKDREFCCARQIKKKGGPGCCNGVIYNKRDNECCGSQLIGKSQVCCSETSTQKIAIDKLQRNHTDCCRMQDRSFKSYNIWDKKCDNGRIMGRQVYTAPAPAPPAQSGPSKRRLNTSTCIYCGSNKNIQLLKTCNLTKEYKVLVKNVIWTSDGTVTKIEVLSPRSNRGHTMDISVPYHCRCFKTGKKYIIYTKRNLGCRTFARLSRTSMIMRNSKYNQQQRQDTCKVRSRLHKII